MKSSSYILNQKSNIECDVYLVVDIPGGHVEYEEWSAYHGDEYPDRVQAYHVEGGSTSKTTLQWLGWFQVSFNGKGI